MSQAAPRSGIHRSTELVNAHINLKIQIQNREILDAISRTSSRQYALQRTVKGISAVAISYYAVSLLSYPFEELAHMFALQKSILMASLVPTIFALVVWRGRVRYRENN